MSFHLNPAANLSVDPIAQSTPDQTVEWPNQKWPVSWLKPNVNHRKCKEYEPHIDIIHIIGFINLDPAPSQSFLQVSSCFFRLPFTVLSKTLFKLVQTHMPINNANEFSWFLQVFRPLFFYNHFPQALQVFVTVFQLFISLA